MAILFDRIQTFWRLGVRNVARVAIYRLAIKLRLHPVLKVKAKPVSGPFYGKRETLCPSAATASRRWIDSAHYFTVHNVALDDFPNRVPDWHANPKKLGVRADESMKWHLLGDFDPKLGDIKMIWEASRFEWLIPMAQRAALGDLAELERLNLWLADWSTRNPPYLGVNWKCGQEASLRVMHLAAASMILDQVHNPMPGLIKLLENHLRRIAPTMSYAIGQQNNHATSEATALFIGGSWLVALGIKDGKKWAKVGRDWLEKLARELIQNDGTFSQYSVVYHRLMLDSYSLAETWRRKWGLHSFSDYLYDRLGLASNWLYQLTEPNNGDAPNLGANDGARILPLSDSAFRDFRPSVQWAAALFLRARAYDSSACVDAFSTWFDVEIPEKSLPSRTSVCFRNGGLHVLRAGKASAYLRFPNYTFRPSQCDALHVDLWLDGMNLLRDAGTYSYNDAEVVDADFATVKFHNSVCFDDRDQMPRISRFLYGRWLKGENIVFSQDKDSIQASAAYRDSFGNYHSRSVTLDEHNLYVEDRLEGQFKSACLQWRMPNGNWELLEDAIIGQQFKLSFEVDGKPLEIEIFETVEARHYGEISTVIGARTIISGPCTIKTRLAVI